MNRERIFSAAKAGDPKARFRKSLGYHRSLWWEPGKETVDGARKEVCVPPKSNSLY